MNPWISAARPKTLSAGLVPVMAASALAFHNGGFHAGICVTALLGCIFIQVATNYINDGSDFLRGADTSERLGPPRMAQMGILTPRGLFIGAGFCFLLASICGLYLILQAGWPILLVGIISILCAIAYTAGPAPLAYFGLGDLFVLLFFGFTAVIGTYFSHTSQSGGLPAILISLIVGLQGVALIAVNNTRDIPTDKMVGKKTMAVRMGRSASNIYYSLILVLPFLLLLLLAGKMHSFFLLAPLVTLPLALKNIRAFHRAEGGGSFNQLLASSAKLQVIFGFLLCLSLLLSK